MAVDQLAIAALEVRPATVQSVVAATAALRHANYRAADEATGKTYAEHVRNLRDEILAEDLSKQFPRHQLEGLIMVMKELQVEVPLYWTESELRAENVPQQQPRRPVLRGEAAFDDMRRSELVRQEFTSMRQAINAMSAHSGSGLCTEAAALFAGLSWTHKNPLLAEAAARSKSAFLQVELDFCQASFPEVSRLDRLIMSLAHTHIAGATLWSQDYLAAWDQFHAWLLSSVIVPLVQSGVGIADVEEVVLSSIWPAAEDKTVAHVAGGQLEVAVDAIQHADFDWVSSIPVPQLSAKMRKLSALAEQKPASSQLTQAGASMSELRSAFKTCLQSLVAFPLPLNWGLRASELGACPLHLAAPGLCPMDMACPLMHHTGDAWWDASDYVFGAENLSIAALRTRLESLPPAPASADAPLHGGFQVPQSQGNPKRRTRTRSKGKHAGGGPNHQPAAPQKAAPAAQAAGGAGGNGSRKAE